MELIRGLWPFLSDPRFVLLCFAGAVAGFFVGSIPGLSVSMATALLVSLTYAWPTTDALAAVMGVYVVGVYAGAIPAILMNIPGAPSSVVTTLDGYPMARCGEAYRALLIAALYSFVGSVFGLLALALLARPMSALALRFHPADYFLLALLGLTAAGSLSSGSSAKGLAAAAIGVFFSLIGLDSVVGTPRLTFGIQALKAGVPTVPALIGLFGFSELLFAAGEGEAAGQAGPLRREKPPLRELLRELPRSLYYCTIGCLVGALPGAGTPVASFLAYGQARRLVKKPERPFGEGAMEGVVASESANNACIGGALIPMLTLGVPGDAVTAIILSVFTIHGLQPGPTFLMSGGEGFHAILAGGLLGCLFLLLLGLLAAPRVSAVIRIPRRILLPLVTVLCVIGSYACRTQLFDVGLMFFFGLLGYLLRRRGCSAAPLTLGLVLGGMMDANFRRAVSLASTAEHPLASLFGRPVTLVLLLLTAAALLSGLPSVKRRLSGRKNRQ